MNETNNEQNQKPKTSKLAMATLLCLVGGPIIGFGIFCLGELIPPFWWALSDKPDPVLWGDALLTTGFLIILAGILAAPILGAAAIVSIVRSKGKLIGLPLAIVPTILAVLICAYLVFASFWIKSRAQRITCSSNIFVLGKAIFTYTNDYDGKLPTAHAWCDLLVDCVGKRKELFKCPLSKQGPCTYALNRNVVGLNMSDIPKEVVLLFEATPGWNQVGGPEILTTEYHGGEGCYVLFADGTVKFVKKEDFDTLRWEP